MFKSAKRLLVAATVVIAASAPSVAYARFFEYGPPADRLRMAKCDLRSPSCGQLLSSAGLTNYKRA